MSTVYITYFQRLKMSKLIFIEKTKEKTRHGHYYWIAQCSCKNIIKCTKMKRLCEKCRKEQITKINKERENNRLNNILLNLDYSPENMYFWGFLWADGHLSSRGIHLSIVDTDMDDIIDSIPNIEFFRIYRYNRESKTRNQKPQTSVVIYNQNYYKFLLENGYKDKSILSPNILLDKNFYMWLRGFIDGDGCWYFNRKNCTRQFIISGKKNQNWSFITNFFDDVGLKYSLSQRFHSTSNSNSSCIRICNKKDIKKLYDFIYKDHLEIGLKRKQIKGKDLI